MDKAARRFKTFKNSIQIKKLKDKLKKKKGGGKTDETSIQTYNIHKAARRLRKFYQRQNSLYC